MFRYAYVNLEKFYLVWIVMDMMNFQMGNTYKFINTVYSILHLQTNNPKSLNIYQHTGFFKTNIQLLKTYYYLKIIKVEVILKVNFVHSFFNS